MEGKQRGLGQPSSFRSQPRFHLHIFRAPVDHWERGHEFTVLDECDLQEFTIEGERFFLHVFGYARAIPLSMETTITRQMRHEVMVLMGSKGGKSRSNRKKAASRLTVVKAREALAAKRALRNVQAIVVKSGKSVQALA